MTKATFSQSHYHTQANNYPCAFGTTVDKNPESTIKTNRENSWIVLLTFPFCFVYWSNGHKSLLFPRLQLNIQKTLLSLCCKPSKQDLFFWNCTCWTSAFMMLVNYYHPLYSSLSSFSFDSKTYTGKKSERCYFCFVFFFPLASVVEHTCWIVNVALSFSMTIY